MSTSVLGRPRPQLWRMHSSTWWRCCWWSCTAREHSQRALLGDTNAGRRHPPTNQTTCPSQPPYLVHARGCDGAIDSLDALTTTQARLWGVCGGVRVRGSSSR
jgi:hypothetical protein